MEDDTNQDLLTLEALEALPATIEALSVPGAEFNLELHQQHLKLATQAGLDEQVDQARLLMVRSLACGDDVWLPLLQETEAKTDLAGVEGVQSLFDLHELSITDYLSIPLLTHRAEFITKIWYDIQEKTKDENAMVDADLAALVTEEKVREILLETTTAARAHIAQSHLVWNVMKDWQLSLLEDIESQDLQTRLPVVHKMFLDRLKSPHAAIDETFSAYNSFVSAYDNENYESRLVAATKAKTEGSGKWSKRQSWEDQLVSPGAHPPSIYPAYIAWELKPKKPDTFLVQSLYARAIADAAARTGFPYQAEPFWISLMAFLAANLKIEHVLLSNIFKAVRSVPVSGELWALYMRILEDYQKPAEQIDGIYRTALGSNVLTVRGPEDAVKTMVARISCERRRLELSEDDEFVELLLEAIAIVNANVKKGDPAFKLEKYLISWFERSQRWDEASTIWQGLSKSHSSSYLVWNGWSAFEIRRGALPKARDVFKGALNKINLIDWPEAVFDAYTEFEQFYGTLESFDEATEKIQKGTQTVANKRHKAAVAAAKNAHEDPYAGYTQEAQAPSAVSMDIDPATAPAVVDTTSMDTSEAETSKKRKAEEVEPTLAGSEAVKKAKAEEPTEATPLVRDRENSTVFVSHLTPEATEDDLKALLRDCGEIREIKLAPGATFGTVEFMTRDSVPAALTRDKKKIKDVEVDVSVASQSTLYITNFPESMDDSSMRAMFEPYGTILETRWPGKKFKGSRRFVYLQFSSSLAAKAALELNKKELEPGRNLLVAISDPSAKKTRTDARANEKQVVVSYLSKYAKKEDLEKVFKQFGTIKEIRMNLDEEGHVRGACFIDFEEESAAKQALSLNNFELKKRRMAVTMPDARRNQKQLNIDNCVRLGNLPKGVQEGLLQQAVEKVAKIQRVSVNARAGEAMIELSSPEDVAKLIESQDSTFVYEGISLPLIPGTQKFPSKEPTTFLPPSASTLPPFSTSTSSAPTTESPSNAEASSSSTAVEPTSSTAPMFRPPPRPRPAKPRPGVGAGRKPPAPAFVPAAKKVEEIAAGSSKPKGQDDFRAMLLKKD